MDSTSWCSHSPDAFSIEHGLLQGISPSWTAKGLYLRTASGRVCMSSGAGLCAGMVKRFASRAPHRFKRRRRVWLQQLACSREEPYEICQEALPGYMPGYRQNSHDVQRPLWEGGLKRQKFFRFDEDSLQHLQTRAARNSDAQSCFAWSGYAPQEPHYLDWPRRSVLKTSSERIANQGNPQDL